jgi:uncharacterized OB-fold protein
LSEAAPAPAAVPAKPEQEYLAHLKAGRFMLQQAQGSGRCFFPPRIAEPGTGDTRLSWVEASGRATVYATTVIRARPPAPSYNVCLVDLAEGPRMMSRIEDIAPEAVSIGLPVRARIVNAEPEPYVVFVPAADGAGA